MQPILNVNCILNICFQIKLTVERQKLFAQGMVPKILAAFFSVNLTIFQPFFWRTVKQSMFFGYTKTHILYLFRTKEKNPKRRAILQQDIVLQTMNHLEREKMELINHRFYSSIFKLNNAFLFPFIKNACSMS